MIPNPLNRNARHPHLAAEREAPPNEAVEKLYRILLQ
jgi:hypothetical protein